ncbi:glycoside hydrolase [Ustulina deusta]|nr:glycoside hydrolase [Ustulina deusta]
MLHPANFFWGTARRIGAYFLAVKRFRGTIPSRPTATDAVGELVLAAAITRDGCKVIQYCGSRTNDQGAKFHIDLLVNTNKNTYATNVLMGEFSIDDKTMRLNGGNPDAASNEWFWSEIKTVQDAGVKQSMWLRQVYEILKDNNGTFDTYYALVNKTITDHSYDSIDLDIEGGQSSCGDDSMNLDDTVHLIRLLRADFGPDFIITLAPVSNALLGEGSKGVKAPNYYERCINEGGWRPERIVTTITTSSDFAYPLPRSSWVGLNETGPTIDTLAEKYADFGGVGGFDYYGAEPAWL